MAIKFNAVVCPQGSLGTVLVDSMSPGYHSESVRLSTRTVPTGTPKVGSSAFVSGNDTILIDLSAWDKAAISQKIELIQTAIEQKLAIRLRGCCPAAIRSQCWSRSLSVRSYGKSLPRSHPDIKETDYGI